MVLYRRRFLTTPVYNFVGDDHEWRSFVIEKSINKKDVYLCDCRAYRRLYPENIKVINSEQTAKRLLGVRLQKSVIFIGDTGTAHTKTIKWRSYNWSDAETVYIRTDFNMIISCLKDKLLEKSSKKRVHCNRKYK